jgi:hypothetical protein
MLLLPFTGTTRPESESQATSPLAGEVGDAQRRRAGGRAQ